MQLVAETLKEDDMWGPFSIKSPQPSHSPWINPRWQSSNTFLPRPEPQLFDILPREMGLSLMSCLRMAAFGWRNTMNECACNSVSSHNGKDSLLYRLCLDSSLGSSDPGSGYIVDGRRITPFIWLFLASVVWLMIMADRSTYL